MFNSRDELNENIFNKCYKIHSISKTYLEQNNSTQKLCLADEDKGTQIPFYPSQRNASQQTGNTGRFGMCGRILI